MRDSGRVVSPSGRQPLGIPVEANFESQRTALPFAAGEVPFYGDGLLRSLVRSTAASGSLRYRPGSR